MVAHWVAMSGPVLVWAAVVNAPMSVSVDWGTSLMLTPGCSFS